MNSFTTVIAGLPRCGSSLLMQMLAAAGMRCAGDYPSFEPDELMENPSEAYVDSWDGGAFKLLDPHRVLLPAGRRYRIIFLTRSRRQQSMSTVKFMALLQIAKGKLDGVGFDRMRESLRKDQAAALHILHEHHCPIIKIRFEDLIEHQLSTVEEICRFLDMDYSKHGPTMLKTIRPRRATCYEGLLEIELMKEIEDRDGIAPPYDPLQCTCNFPGSERPCSYCKSGDFSLPDEAPAEAKA